MRRRRLNRQADPDPLLFDCACGEGQADGTGFGGNKKEWICPACDKVHVLDVRGRGPKKAIPTLVDVSRPPPD